MKKILLISLLAILVLTGCSSQQKGLSQDELFQKKLECANYENTFMNKLKNQYRQYFDDSYGFTKEAIFYSPKLNTCVFAFFAVPMPKMYDFDNNTKYHIVDMFTQEGLFYGQYDPDINNIDAIDLEFNNKIQELKGE